MLCYCLTLVWSFPDNDMQPCRRHLVLSVSGGFLHGAPERVFAPQVIPQMTKSAPLVFIRSPPPPFHKESKRGRANCSLHAPGHTQLRACDVRDADTALARMVLAKRNPLLLFRLSGLFLLRLAERKFAGLLFQEPPRSTRFLRA